MAIADGPAQFVAACERILNWTGAERAAFEAAARARVASTSWDSTAARVEALLARFEPQPAGETGGIASDAAPAAAAA